MTIRTLSDAERAAVADAAELDPIEYGRIRLPLAERLGVRVADLDAQVRLETKDDKEPSGTAFSFPDPDWWTEEVDGESLLDDLVICFARYLALPDGGADLLA